MIWRMPNMSLAINLPAAERTQLEQWESAQGTPQQVALRCRIILGALAGQQNVAIAEELGVSRPTVLLWRRRVREQGIGEVWHIAQGRGASHSSIRPRASGSSKRPCIVSPRG